ncbi:MAG: thermonuclease family protein [Thiogranum sp.]|nr:thermonuclease family protein [Thiogranum sp.]
MPKAKAVPGKASLVGAFFVLACWQQNISAADCSPPVTAEAVQVRYIHDGDTLVLADNRKVRLIGINTPEVSRNGEPAQALAINARDRLRQLLFEQSNKARILYGQQKVDDHGRSLAHLWSPDGTNLAAVLLREGLGWAVAIPPNVRLLECYLESERQALEASRGVWDRPDYHAIASNQLSLRDEGFMRVKGRVTRVNHGGGATWINLEGRFAVRIPDQDLQWFANRPDTTWLGRELEVRGWLYVTKGESRITVNHPAAITMVRDR